MLRFPVAALLVAMAVPALAGEIVGRTTVTDGDTIEIRGERIRFNGIDAPESAQLCLDASGAKYRCGQRAAFALADRIGHRTVRCETNGRDRYGRHIGRCFTDEIDLNRWMVRQGHALAYRRYSTAYLPGEEAARRARRGIWQGEFDAPWNRRHGARRAAEPRAVAQAAALQDCVIKGNISSERIYIYHVPGGRFYDRTRIGESKGERWFCSEQEARAAGWRPSRR